MKSNGISVPSKELWDLADAGIQRYNRITLRQQAAQEADRSMARQDVTMVTGLPVNCYHLDHPP